MHYKVYGIVYTLHHPPRRVVVLSPLARPAELPCRPGLVEARRHRREIFPGKFLPENLFP